MSGRLGESLVEAGTITEAQLHRALTAQLVFGGHLGTSLLELGFIDEETLGEKLAARFGVPYADIDTLSRVPFSVIKSLPARLVEKHKVVPLRLEARTLHLAMIDPRNLLALDEISFVTGYRIVPWVAPEVRILQVLERHYSIPRSQRYATLTRELSRLNSRRERLRPLQNEEAGIEPLAAPPAQMALAAAEVSVASPDPVPAPAMVRTTGPDPEPPAASAAAIAGGGSPPMTGHPPSSARGAEATPDHWEKYGYGRSWRELAEALEAEELGADERTEEVDTRPHPKTAAAPVHGREADLVPPSLLEAARRLAEAGTVEAIVDSTLSYLGGRLARSVFFVLKGERLIVWSAQGFRLSPRRMRGLSFEPAEGGGLLDLAGPRTGERATHYLGAVPPGRASAEFYEWLGVPPPRTMLLAPIVVKGRVTGYLYGDGGDREILAVDLPAVLSLCARAGFALQILILRNKILAA